LEPAQALAVSGTILIMIDALDESGDESERQALLDLLALRLSEMPPSFRFLITSREEGDVREAFSATQDQLVIQRMPTVDSDADLTEDVLTYIRQNLLVHGRFPKGLSDAACQALATRSEGLFQWAFLACSYITNQRPGPSPAKRYERLIGGSDTGLDTLYKTVLAQLLRADSGEDEHAEILRIFKLIMGMIIFASEALSMQTLQSMFDMLPEHAFDDYPVLPFLGSLLSGVGKETDPVRPLHSSFSEFLRDAKRSEQYYVSGDGCHERLLFASLRLLSSDRLHFNMANLHTSYALNRDIPEAGDRIAPDLRYACKYWGDHMAMAGDGPELQSQELSNLLRTLFMEKLLFWMEAASLVGSVAYMTSCISWSLDRLPVSTVRIRACSLLIHGRHWERIWSIWQTMRSVS
jgi:hypothetical protein